MANRYWGSRQSKKLQQSLQSMRSFLVGGLTKILDHWEQVSWDTLFRNYMEGCDALPGNSMDLLPSLLLLCVRERSWERDDYNHL